MKVREIIVNGFKVDIYNFGYASFFYPSFNGNAEFKLNKKGYRKLSSYLRTLEYFKQRILTPKQ